MEREKLLPEFDGLTVITHVHQAVGWGDGRLGLMSLEKKAKKALGRLKRSRLAGASAELAEVALKDPDAIPIEWRPYTLVFTGTIFKNGAGKECFVTLYFFGHWTWDYVSLEDPLGKDDRLVFIQKKGK